MHLTSSYALQKGCGYNPYCQTQGLRRPCMFCPSNCHCAHAGVGMFGTKAGMMTYFMENGKRVAATVLALEEGNIVTMVKTDDTDGYNAVQVNGTGTSAHAPRAAAKCSMRCMLARICRSLNSKPHHAACNNAAPPCASLVQTPQRRYACCSYPAKRSAPGCS